MTDANGKDTSLRATNPIDLDRLDLDSGVVRPPSAHEVEVARVLLTQAYAGYRTGVPVQIWQHLERRIILGQVVDRLLVYSSGPHVLAVAALGDGPVAGWPSGWAAMLTLGVHESVRGRGIGRRLLQGCLMEAAGGGTQALGVHLLPSMSGAGSWLERSGFVREPDHDLSVARMYETDGVSVLDRRWDLPSDALVGIAYVCHMEEVPPHGDA